MTRLHLFIRFLSEISWKNYFPLDEPSKFLWLLVSRHHSFMSVSIPEVRYCFVTSSFFIIILTLLCFIFLALDDLKQLLLCFVALNLYSFKFMFLLLPPHPLSIHSVSWAWVSSFISVTLQTSKLGGSPRSTSLEQCFQYNTQGRHHNTTSFLICEHQLTL